VTTFGVFFIALNPPDFKRSAKQAALSLHDRFLMPKKGSLLEGVELSARCAGDRQAKRRRSGTPQGVTEGVG